PAAPVPPAWSGGAAAQAPPREVAPPPPRVSLSSPADQARVSQDWIALAGVVTSGRGITRLVVTMNGNEVARQEERSPATALPLSALMTLREGQNTLAVTVTEADGGVHQDVRTVYYDKAVPLTITFRSPVDGA